MFDPASLVTSRLKMLAHDRHRADLDDKQAWVHHHIETAKQRMRDDALRAALIQASTEAYERTAPRLQEAFDLAPSPRIAALMPGRLTPMLEKLGECAWLALDDDDHGDIEIRPAGDPSAGQARLVHSRRGDALTLTGPNGRPRTYPLSHDAARRLRDTAQQGRRAMAKTLPAPLFDEDALRQQARQAWADARKRLDDVDQGVAIPEATRDDASNNRPSRPFRF